MDKLEEQIHSDLQQYLLCVNEIDERLPECPDVEDRWEAIANAYIPDGVREFQNYPLASLGWMMYIGMALAKMWDDDWQYYSAKEDLYVYLRIGRFRSRKKCKIRHYPILFFCHKSAMPRNICGYHFL